MKTKEWLTNHLADGEILSGSVLQELIESYVHKSEVSVQVAAGDARPVSSGGVKTAIDAAAASITAAVGAMVEEMLEEMLPGLLAGYVTSAGLASAIADMATKTWVNTQLATKASMSEVNAAIVEKADLDDLTGMLSGKADAAAVYTKAEADNLLAGKASVQGVYTKQEIDAVIAARPTHTEMAGEVAESIDELPNNATIASIMTKLNSVIARTNTLSHVACGSETLQACLSDINPMQTS